MDYKQIIERMSLIRTRNNLSSREFGLMLGNSETYFYKVEDNSIILNVPKLLEILESLNISTEEFFYDDFDNYKKDKEILDILKNMPKDKKESLLAFIKK